MTPAWWALLAVGLLCAAVALACFGWVAARWWQQRRGPDHHAMRARQALIDALTDPRPNRWQ